MPVDDETFRPLPEKIGVLSGGRPQISIRHNDEPLDGLPPRIWMDQFTTYRMHSTTKLISVMAERLYAERLGINIVESRVLNLVAVLGPVSTREVSAQSRMNRVQVSRASQSLVRLGLLDRIENQADRRLINLTLTPAGLLAHQEIVGLLNWFEQSVCDALGMEEVRTLRAGLNRLELHFHRLWRDMLGGDAESDEADA